MNNNKITNLTPPTAASDAANKSYVDTSIPIGGIIMWSGAIATIPTNWKLCNGGFGTPDLRNTFVVGADSDATGGQGQAFAVTNIEGAGTRKLTGGTKDAVVVEHHHSITDPGHTHNQLNGQDNDYLDGTGGINARRASKGNYSGTIIINNTTGITGTNNQGVDGTNKNLPPYYALAFIMRVS